MRTQSEVGAWHSLYLLSLCSSVASRERTAATRSRTAGLLETTLPNTIPFIVAANCFQPSLKIPRTDRRARKKGRVIECRRAAAPKRRQCPRFEQTGFERRLFKKC